jgi:hypothetical protein
MDMRTALDAGKQMSPEQAADLQQSANDGGILSASQRVQLIGFYLRHEDYSAALFAHMLWAVEHLADSPFWRDVHYLINAHQAKDAVIQEFRCLWLAQIDAAPDNAAIIANAGMHLESIDPDLSEQLMVRARELNPRDFLNSINLFTIWLYRKKRDADRAIKLDALGRELLDLQLESPEYLDLHSREFLLRDMARLAERLGDATRAAIYIKEADEIKRREAEEDAKIAHLPIIYVDLLQEGTVCWREIRAEHIRDNIYKIVSKNRSHGDEIWLFNHGDVVECCEKIGKGNKPSFMVTVRKIVNLDDDSHR